MYSNSFTPRAVLTIQVLNTVVVLYAYITQAEVSGDNLPPLSTQTLKLSTRTKGSRYGFDILPAPLTVREYVILHHSPLSYVKTDFLFCSRIPVLLANRLYLNLKTWDDSDKDVSQRTSELSGIDFAGSAMLGRIGAPIRTMDEDILYLQASDTVIDKNPDEGEVNNPVHVQTENMSISPVVRLLIQPLSDTTHGL